MRWVGGVGDAVGVIAALGLAEGDTEGVGDATAARDCGPPQAAPKIRTAVKIAVVAER
jgi:hypothetical protein